MPSAKRQKQPQTSPDGSAIVVAISLPDGTLYSGRAVGNVPDGSGTVKFFGGVFFKGEFKNGAPEGAGDLRLSNQEVYRGTFSDRTFKGVRTDDPSRSLEAHLRGGRLYKGAGSHEEQIVAEKEQPVPAPRPRKATPAQEERPKAKPKVQFAEAPAQQEEYQPRSTGRPAIQFAETPAEEQIYEEPVQEPEEETVPEEPEPQPVVVEEHLPAPAETVPATVYVEKEPQVVEKVVKEYVYIEKEAKEPWIPHYPKKRFVATNGTKEFPEGIYEGDLVNGKRNGKGLFKLFDGTTYEGEFKNNYCHGHIVMKNPSKNMYFDGEYKNGEMRSGTLIINNMTYIGEFRRGIYHGPGKFIGSDGTVLEGMFRWGKYIGPKKTVESPEDH